MCLIKKDEDGRRAGGRRRIGGKDCSSSGGGTGPPSGLSSAGVDHLGNDGESSSGWSPKSRDEDSRASSIEKEVGNINLSSDLSNSNSALQTPSGKVFYAPLIKSLFTVNVFFDISYIE